MRQINTIVIHHSVTDPNNKNIWSESIDGRDYHPGYRIDGKEYKGKYDIIYLYATTYITIIKTPSVVAGGFFNGVV